MLARFYSVDYLKLFLAIGVVFGHSILINNHLVGWSFVTGIGLLRSMVPAFSILSGFLLFFIHQRGKTNKWLSGLVFLYVFWTVFYAPMWMRGDMPWSEALWNMFWGPMHLWYVAGLLHAALILLALLWVGERTGSGVKPLIVGAVLAGILEITLAVMTFAPIWQLSTEVVRNGLTVIFPFAAIGYLIAKFVAERGIEALPRTSVVWTLVFVLFTLRLFEASISFFMYGPKLPAIPELPLLSYPAVALLFIGFLRLDLPKPAVDLSLWSSSIYFLHIFLIQVMRHFGIDNIWIYLLVGVVGSVLVAEVFVLLRPVLMRYWKTAVATRTSKAPMQEP
ncbi:acyltransferase family protein [Paracoccus aestuariivivens]|nr:acyltransferase family protein [Paracoccus aestuariivivens]